VHVAAALLQCSGASRTEEEVKSNKKSVKLPFATLRIYEKRKKAECRMQNSWQQREGIL